MLGMVKGIDDLEFLETLGPLKEGQNGTLNDQIVQIQIQEFLSRNPVEKLHVLAVVLDCFLGIPVEKAFFVLEKDERLCSNVFSK